VVVNYEFREIREEDISSITGLFIENYFRVLEKHPNLPARYATRDAVNDYVSWMVGNGVGIVAIDNSDEIVGYMTAIEIDDFKNSGKGLYTPEWGHGAAVDDPEWLYSQLYTYLYDACIGENCHVHAITIMDHDEHLIRESFFNGYGMLLIDGIKKVEDEIPQKTPYKVRQAKVSDLDQIVAILDTHYDYMYNSPIFLFSHAEDLKDSVRAYLEDETIILWVAEQNDKLIAVMKTQYNADNASTIVMDEKSLSIQETHVIDEARNQKVAKSLLTHVEKWAFEHSFERLTVDFETANILARRFWLKYFQPVCHSMIRYIDDRIE
jgi:ribosomal protein S18 acetylase RimI-like enzyme